MTVIKQQLSWLPHLAGLCMSLPILVHAQGIQSSAVMDQRDKTRSQVEAVTADQPGALDEAGTLGLSLIHI